MAESSSQSASRSLTADLTPEACKILSASLAEPTKQAYRHSWTLLLQYAPSIRLPVESITLCNFIASLFDVNYSPSSIASHISAISFVHKVQGLDDPGQSFLVRKMLKGCNNLAKSCDSRLPITATILKKIVLALDKISLNYNTRLLTRTVFLLAFHAFMRLGELVIRSPAKANLVLQRSDVSFNSASGKVSAQLILRDFKHNTEKTPVIICLNAGPNAEFCPVRSLMQYVSIFRHQTGPLFQFIDGKPVPASFISLQLQKVVEFIGLNPKFYKGHSFRIGAATHAANQGFSENYIQKLGRWHSNAIRRYIRIDTFQI